MRKPALSVVFGVTAGVLIAIYLVTLAILNDVSFLGILTILAIGAVVTPIGLMLGDVISKWLGFRR